MINQFSIELERPYYINYVNHNVLCSTFSVEVKLLTFSNGNSGKIVCDNFSIELGDPITPNQINFIRK